MSCMRITIHMAVGMPLVYGHAPYAASAHHEHVHSPATYSGPPSFPAVTIAFVPAVTLACVPVATITSLRTNRPSSPSHLTAIFSFGPCGPPLGGYGAFCAVSRNATPPPHAIL